MTNIQTKITPNIKASAMKCSKNCSCLVESKREICQMDFCVGEEIHFVSPPKDRTCHYMSQFGKGSICECPVRKELFKRHQI